MRNLTVLFFFGILFACAKDYNTIIEIVRSDQKKVISKTTFNSVYFQNLCSKQDLHDDEINIKSLFPNISNNKFQKFFKNHYQIYEMLYIFKIVKDTTENDTIFLIEGRTTTPYKDLLPNSRLIIDSINSSLWLYKKLPTKFYGELTKKQGNWSFIKDEKDENKLNAAKAFLWLQNNLAYKTIYESSIEISSFISINNNLKTTEIIQQIWIKKLNNDKNYQ